MRPPTPGFDTSRVSPQDAVVTLRSLRRRFAEAFEQADDAHDVSRRPAGASLSPLGHAAWTASALERIGVALGHVLRADNPHVELPPVDPLSASGPPDRPATAAVEDTAAVLARLGEVAQSVTDTMADAHGADWSRPAQAAGAEISALDIARLAVRIGVEHLRAVKHILADENRAVTGDD